MRIFKGSGRIARFLGWGITVLLLAGCVHAPTIQYPPFPDQTKRIDDPAKARVYLMRPGGGYGQEALIFYGNDWAATGAVFEPNTFGTYRDAHLRRIGEIGPHGYICWETPPHVFHIERVEGRTNSVVSIDLEADHVYYLDATARFGWMRTTASTALLPEAEGQKLLEKCDPPRGYSKTKPH